MMLKYQRCSFGNLLPPPVLKGQEEERECLAWEEGMPGGSHCQKCGIREEVGKSIPT